jgi:hypothetical protein
LGQKRRKKSHPPVVKIKENDLLSGPDGQRTENQVPGREFREAAAQFSERMNYTG